MRYLNVRQLARNLGRELDKLPIAVTRYGKPIAVIQSFDIGKTGKTNVRQTAEPSSTNVRQADKSSVEGDVIQSSNKLPQGRCSIPGCKKFAFDTGPKWNKELGEFGEALYCPAHLAAAKSERR